MVGTTLNPFDKASGITLSGGDLTASSTGTSSVRAITRKSAGKFYFETQITTLSAGGVGIANASAPLSTSGWADAVTVAVGGLIYINSSTGVNIGAVGSGSLVCFAVDFDNKRFWARLGAAGNWNGNASYNPATNTGGVDFTSVASTGMYPYMFLYSGSSSATLNAGDTTFSGTAPSGFTSGWPAGLAEGRVTQVAVEEWATVAGGGTVVLLTGGNTMMGGPSAPDGSTTFIDESPAERTLTAFGNAQIDTAQSRFGGSSLLFDGTGDYVIAADSLDWTFNMKFTVECWVRFNSVAADSSLISHWDNITTNAGWWFVYSSLGYLTFTFYNTNTTPIIRTTSGAWSPLVNTWYHVAADRDVSGNVRVYVDGVMKQKQTYTDSMRNSTNPLSIGRIQHATPAYLNGWLDEVRITKDAALYASDAGFTVPTSAFPRDEYPVLVRPRRVQNIQAHYRSLAIYGTPVTTALEDSAYAGFAVFAIGGTSPYTYSLVGTWPAGITVNSSTGLVSGTPTDAGTFTGLSVRATDDAGTTADLATFTLTVSAAIIPDPYWANVVLLTGGNVSAGGGAAADASTTFIDESVYARALTAQTAAQIDTAQSKFGGSSILLNGAGDYVTAADSNDWDFGTGAFTVEGWFRFTTLNGGYIALIMQWSGGWAFYFDSGQLFLRPGTGSDTTKYTWSPTLNTWYHLAIDRDASNVARIYVDGAMVSKTTSYTVNLTGSTAKLALGSLREAGFSGYDMSGWLDEVRITKGIARYASDSGYTVPTAAFPRTGLTMTTFNSSDKNTGVTLSGGNLVATNNNNVQVQGVRAGTGKSTGKYYWEVMYTVNNNVCDAVGLCRSTYDLSKQMNNSTTGDGYVAIAPFGSVRVWVDGANTTISDAIVSGSLMCVAVDLDAHLIWYRKGTSGFWNVGGSANPATGVGGISIPTGTLFPMVQVGSTGSQLTANFGATPFSGVWPDGYTLGWPA